MERSTLNQLSKIDSSAVLKKITDNWITYLRTFGTFEQEVNALEKIEERSVGLGELYKILKLLSNVERADILEGMSNNMGFILKSIPKSRTKGYFKRDKISKIFGRDGKDELGNIVLWDEVVEIFYKTFGEKYGIVFYRQGELRCYDGEKLGCFYYSRDVYGNPNIEAPM